MNAQKYSRSFWPAAIIGFFILAMTFLVSFIVWASRERNDLVSEDYYDTEIRYQQQIDRLSRSRDLGAQPIVSYDDARRRIIIRLPNAAARTPTGIIHLYRPSDARLDRDATLAVNAGGVQILDATRLPGGLWKVRVQWKVAGEEFFCDQSVLLPG